LYQTIHNVKFGKEQCKSPLKKKGLKGGISIDADSGSLGYFDAVVVEVEKSLLFFRLVLLGHTVQSFKYWIDYRFKKSS